MQIYLTESRHHLDHHNTRGGELTAPFQLLDLPLQPLRLTRRLVQLLLLGPCEALGGLRRRTNAAAEEFQLGSKAAMFLFVVHI